MHSCPQNRNSQQQRNRLSATYTKRSLPLASKKAKRHHTVGAIRLRCIITSKLTVTNPEKLLLTLRESNERCSFLHLQIQGAVQPGGGWLQMAEDEQAGLALLVTTLL